MQTAKEVEKEFIKDLAALLKKYDASEQYVCEMEVEDQYPGYAECGEDLVLTVTIPAIYVDNECEREYTTIELRGWITSKILGFL